uniref:Uncharacterized protein n=1 Tax=Anguilla anguilla TaxID=7936 RepID=A0A0E9SJI7_ANGAN
MITLFHTNRFIGFHSEIISYISPPKLLAREKVFCAKTVSLEPPTTENSQRQHVHRFLNWPRSMAQNLTRQLIRKYYGISTSKR